VSPPLPRRLPGVLAGAAATAALIAAPALASEDPLAPAPGPALPGVLGAVGFTPGTAPGTPAGRAKVRPAIQRASLSQRRIRRGQRAVLRLGVSTTGRVHVVMRQRAGRRHVPVAAFTVPATTTRFSVRLPRRANGHFLRPGRYRITVVADAGGMRSRAVRRSLVVVRRT
jgi:hypothetical protein